ncbi:MAG: ABC transporter ATP-binding protein [Elusimicrobiota bacterium]
MKNIGINISNVTRKFGETVALENVIVNVEPGTLNGFIGPDGAGKTTLFRILAGLLRKDNGSIRYNASGRDVGFEDIRPTLAYMPSKQSLYPDLSIDEHLIFFKDLYSLPEKDFSERSKELLNITRLEKFRDRKIGNLSGGMYKKVGLMCAMLQSPSMMLLDEPTNGVDPISRREFWDLLHRLSEQKILILISTSYMDEAERCAFVHLMDSGKIMMSGRPEELLAREKVKGFDEVFIKMSHG